MQMNEKTVEYLYGLGSPKLLLPVYLINNRALDGDIITLNADNIVVTGALTYRRPLPTEPAALSCHLVMFFVSVDLQIK